ncbi:MAG: hypothetical protein JNK75_01505 [Betaproteobacteria bacterium]|nr:hypothetical protein [Betaproteobacteria bacterium]
MHALAAPSARNARRPNLSQRGWDLLVAGGVVLLLGFWIPRAGLLPDTGAGERLMQAAPAARSQTPRPAGPTGLHPHQWEAGAGLLHAIAAVRSQPAHGGYYRALKAYDFCAREARLTLDTLHAEGLPPAVAHAPRQRAAQQGLLQLCAGFFPQRLTDIDYHALAEEGLQRGDGKLIQLHALERLSAGWERMDAGEREQSHALIATLLAEGDADLLVDLAQELEVLMNAAVLSLGERALTPVESFEVLDGLRLLACQRGGACQRDSGWHALLACASAGECEPSAGVGSVSAVRGLALLQRSLARGERLGLSPLREQRF